MPASDSPVPRFNRRTLIKAGLAGSVALFASGWLYHRSGTPKALSARIERGDAGEVLRAIVPVMLAGALPTAAGDLPAAIQRVLANVAGAVAMLPVSMRGELDDLFAMLAFAPTRIAIAGVTEPWGQADSASIAKFLAAWRDSALALKRSAYGALHQLITAAWYGDPSAWAAIGYPGPPALGAPA
jgi:hypothetical protein